MNKKVLFLLSLCLSLVQTGLGQAKKIKTDAFIWTDLQADYYLKNQSYFFFRNQWRHNTDDDFPGIKDTGLLSKFYQVYVLAGYEQRFTDHWSGSLSARYTFDVVNDNKIVQAILRHNGKIGEVTFTKRLAYDFVFPELGNTRGRIRPFMGLERNFTLGNHTIRPHISYELFFYQEFSDQDQLVDARTVDRTRLRIAASFKVSPNIWITPHFIKQTEYYNVLPTYTGELDASGNQVEKEPGGKRNRVTPIFGLDLRFIFNASNLSDKTLPVPFR